jgi:hypothetical protein
MLIAKSDPAAWQRLDRIVCIRGHAAADAGAFRAWQQSRPLQCRSDRNVENARRAAVQLDCRLQDPERPRIDRDRGGSGLPIEA